MHKKGERTLLFELQNEAKAEVVVDEAVIVPFARSDGAVNGVALPTAAAIDAVRARNWPLRIRLSI